MYSTHLTTHVGKDGMLNLSVPLNIQDQDVEIVVVVQPKITHTQHPDSTNHLENIIGAWQGDRLERPPQGEYEIRKDFI